MVELKDYQRLRLRTRANPIGRTISIVGIAREIAALTGERLGRNPYPRAGSNLLTSSRWRSKTRTSARATRP